MYAESSSELESHMQIERAIIQQTVTGRDGASLTRECPRPEHVIKMAQRLHRWKDTYEGCQLCQSDNAVSVRSGVAVCGRCHANMEIRRAGYDFGRKVVPLTRAASNPDGLSGLAIVFDSLSVDLGGFFERIAPAAVDRTLAEGIDVVQLAHHNTEKPLARLSAGNLRLRKTSRGLANVVDAADTSDGRDMVRNIRAGNITGQSFGFSVMPDGDDWEMEGDLVVRTVFDTRIYETSFVVWPAYRKTEAYMSDDSTRRDVDFLQKVHRTRMAR